jgi:beta-glucosidase
MKSKFLYIVPIILFIIFSFKKNNNENNGLDGSLPQLGKNSIHEILQALTLEEKVNLITGMGMFISGLPEGMIPEMDPSDAGIPDKILGSAGRTHAIPRLGIPSITLSDGPAGVRISPIRGNDSTKTYYATAFPIGTLVASTWDTDLVLDMGKAIGNEAKEYGVDVLLGPAMNIHRNSLAGRNFEYFSEDPLVSGSIAAAIVNGVQSNGIGTSMKHFAANNHEFNRFRMNVHVSERALREIYLKNFQVALQKADPWTIMSSYNMINGTYTSQNSSLLDTYLRQESGFKGLVMTDWFAGKNAVEQMVAGNDLLMPGTKAQKISIIDAVKTGKLSMKQLDENVKHVLELVLKSPTFKGYKYSESPNLKQHAKISRQVASEGMVLLKNEGVLPMTTIKKVALFGNNSYELIAGGTGSGDVNKSYMISLDKGLENANYTVQANLATSYKHYYKVAKAKLPPPASPFHPHTVVPEMHIDTALAQKMALENDIAIFTIGKHSGEFVDRTLSEDFNLTNSEKAALDAVSKAFHLQGKKVVVVLNIGGVIETASWNDNADAILLAWQGGLESGNAIADILKGNVNPSGKLATTFPVAYTDEPSSKNYPGKVTEVITNKMLLADTDAAEVTYEEGIYVGYRYFNTFKVKSSYAFGYGLSYTTFRYDNLTLSSTTFKDKLKVTITVTNSGKVAGKEIVQLYLSAPTNQLNKPESELKAFGKTKLLRLNESQTLIFNISTADLASFSPAKSSWIADAGRYTIKIGSSSLDIKNKAFFTLQKLQQLSKTAKILLPQKAIKELSK